MSTLLALLPSLAGVFLTIAGLLGWTGRLSVQGFWAPDSTPNRRAGRAQTILGCGVLAIGLALVLSPEFLVPMLIAGGAAIVVGGILRWHNAIRHGLGSQQPR